MYIDAILLSDVERLLIGAQERFHHILVQMRDGNLQSAYAEIMMAKLSLASVDEMVGAAMEILEGYNEEEE
jgi:hypothetical protein